jgi:hypothetical protein
MRKSPDGVRELFLKIAQIGHRHNDRIHAFDYTPLAKKHLKGALRTTAFGAKQDLPGEPEDRHAES